MLTDKTQELAAAKSPEKIAEKRRALGRGLDTLLPGGPRVAGESSKAPRPGEHAPGQEVLQLRLDEISPNPFQTRSAVKQEYLEQLAESIGLNGVLQPITVRPAKDGKYALIAGECRWKASAIAGKATIPALVKVVSDQQSLELTIIENLQRQDLNCLDQARAFDRLSREFQLTQEEIAFRTGQTRPTISNYMRLLRLPKSVQEMLGGSRLTFGQAKAIMTVDDPDTQLRLANKAANQGTTVRQLEDLIFNMGVPASGGRQPGEKRYVDPNVRQAQGDLERALGVRVMIRDVKGKGSITLQYRTLEDFDRVVGMLSGK